MPAGQLRTIGPEATAPKPIASPRAFNDSAYFCNLFKRRLGLSPSAWRQQRRGY